MIIVDKIWGTFTITQPVIIELIKSNPVQRLKKINMAGAPKYILPWKTVTRYSHSLGVMLLLRKFNAVLLEQIAGLLHDVPHTAFSHTIDFVFPSKNHEYHDKHLEKIITNSEIPKILTKYGISLEHVLNLKNLTLLETKIPDICADRIDYVLRDEMSEFGVSEVIRQTPKGLIVKNNRFYFNNKLLALKFAHCYLNRDTNTWSNPRETVSAKILADAIKKAYEMKEITSKDLFGNDETLEKILKKSKNSYVQSKLKQLSPNLTIKIDKKDFDFHLINKLRYIDPQIILKDGSIKRVSQLFPEFKKKLAEHNKIMRQGFYIKIVS